MKTLSVILLLFLTFPSMAQEKALEMSKNGSEKTRVFKENKRVKVKTLDGEKYIGRFQILNASTIEIEENIIPLNSISKYSLSWHIRPAIAVLLLIISGKFRNKK